ncbi:MAG TPA: CinA family protein, partial [Tissierellaceae bacterium]
GYDSEVIKEEYEYNINLIKDKLKDYIFGYGNIKIEEAIIDLLRKNNYKLGLCESCTGGLVSSKITSISGSSDVFDCSLVTYSNEAKMVELNVNKNTLDEYGAVSKQTAYEMAKGLMDKRDLDIVVSITGIAGPNSDDTNKPVGLVYICVMTKSHYNVVKCNFFGTRKSIQNKTTMKVFELIRNELI